jgi:OmpA-OmpF porin, OOP family
MHRPLSAFLILYLVVAPAMALSPAPTPTIFFDSGSIVITPPNDKVVRSAVDTFQQIGNQAHMANRAHTDGAEARPSSVTLPPARAEAVKKRLVELGVPADRIEVWVYADSRPMVFVPSGAAEPRNRRVEIDVRRQ